MDYLNDYKKYQKLYEQEKQRYSKKGLNFEAQRIRESYEMQIAAAKDSVTIEALKNEELLKLQKVSSDAYLAALKDFATEEKNTFSALKKDVSSIYDDIASIADEKIGSVIASQEKLEEKLSSYGYKFSKNIVYGGGANGETLNINLLNDYTQTNRQLEEYYKAITVVKEKLTENGYGTDVASDFLSIMSDMSIEDGLTFSNLLANSSGHSFRVFMNGYLKNQQLSQDISKALYSDEFNRAVDETASYMKSELTKIGFEVPESFSLSGTISAEKFGASFVLELEHQLEDIRNMISSFSAEILSTASLPALTSNINAPSSNVTYNQSFSVGTEKSSLFDQINAWKTATAAARLRGE